MNTEVMNNEAAQEPIVIEPVSKDTIREATKTLMEYKSSKQKIDQRILENTNWYRVRHWEELERKKTTDEIDQIRPSSSWLLNSILNKHADMMDNFPSANILPREEADVPEAQDLTSIIPVILDQQHFEETYSNNCYAKLINGASCYGVFWDGSADHGLGEITIKEIDLLNLFWEPGINDIQDSQNVFYVTLVDQDQLMAMYPQLEGKVDMNFLVKKHETEETVDDTKKAQIVDWYYKKNVDGNTILHYCKFVGDEILYSTENDNNIPMDTTGRPAGIPMSMTGIYAHGRYPFVIDKMYPIPGQIVGFGLVDVGKSAQEYVDRADKAFMENMLDGVSPRYFSPEDGVNEEEFADRTKKIVHVQGSLSDRVIPIDYKSLDATYVNHLANKIDELKETTGARDVATGGTTSGVTAASAISAMMESSGKTSRDLNKAGYRAFMKIIEIMIELIRQFYSLPHYFRIMGNNGAIKFKMYQNVGLQPKIDPTTGELAKIPLFDVQISTEKQSPYSKMAQNELALQFYGAGFFNPLNAPAALACLTMMDFDRKDQVVQIVSQNAMLLQQTQPMQQTSGSEEEPEDQVENERLGGDGTEESKITKNAREEANQVATPR